MLRELPLEFRLFTFGFAMVVWSAREQAGTALCTMDYDGKYVGID